jgi:hypothetical protein
MLEPRSLNQSDEEQGGQGMLLHLQTRVGKEDHACILRQGVGEVCEIDGEVCWSRKCSHS